MSSDLVNLINEFSVSIRPDLVESLHSALRAVTDAEEFDRNPMLISSFSQLITLLASRRIPEAEAINLYMSDPNTRGSVSRPFFYHMTFPGLLYPEDNPVYPPAPAALPALGEQASHLPPRIELPADFFAAPPRIPREDEARAPGIVPRDEDDNNNFPNEVPPNEDDDNNEDDNNDPMDFEEY